MRSCWPSRYGVSTVSDYDRCVRYRPDQLNLKRQSSSRITRKRQRYMFPTLGARPCRWRGGLRPDPIAERLEDHVR